MKTDQSPRIVVNIIGTTLGVLYRPGPLMYRIANDLESSADLHHYWLCTKYKTLQIVHVLGAFEQPVPRVQRRRGSDDRVFVELSIEDMLHRDQSSPGMSLMEDPLYLRLLEASLFGMLAAAIGPSENTAWLRRDYEACRAGRLRTDEARGLSRV